MAQVIMLGSEGAGKSTLLTVLASQYRAIGDSPYFLEATNREADAFTQNNWHLLTKEREFPAATDTKGGKEFCWKLHVRRVPPFIIDLISYDIAGESFRKVFGRDEVEKEFVSRVSTADAIVLLVNLADILDEADIVRKQENEWAIKACLDAISKKQGKRFCVVFTKADCYRGLLSEVKGDCRALVKKYLPQIDGAFPNIHAMAVSAVNQTVVSEGANGLFFEKPASNFASENLEALLRWISETKTTNQAIKAAGNFWNTITTAIKNWLGSGQQASKSKSARAWKPTVVCSMIGLLIFLNTCEKDVPTPRLGGAFDYGTHSVTDVTGAIFATFILASLAFFFFRFVLLK